MTEEEYLRDQLVALHRSYKEAAQPYIDRLLEIEASKPPKPIFIMGDRFLPDEKEKSSI